MKNLAINAAMLVLSIALVMVAASMGGLFGIGDWYRALIKPTWNPPNWIFGPVWSTLYLMMAVAAWLIWMKRGTHPVGLPLGLYAVQLALNAAWTAIFFGAHRMGWAFAEIALLDALILACVVAFWPVSRPASLMMVPYFAWVSFASFLNFTLWRLNA
jgi:benzodiazapine receptor